jgi:hypothetical protein
MVDTDGKADEQPSLPASTWRAMAVWALCFGYVVFLPGAGFLLLTPPLIAAGLWVLRLREPVTLVLISVVPVALLFWLLSIVLNVRLPLGPLAPYLA